MCDSTIRSPRRSSNGRGRESSQVSSECSRLHSSSGPSTSRSILDCRMELAMLELSARTHRSCQAHDPRATKRALLSATSRQAHLRVTASCQVSVVVAAAAAAVLTASCQMSVCRWCARVRGLGVGVMLDVCACQAQHIRDLRYACVFAMTVVGVFDWLGVGVLSSVSVSVSASACIRAWWHAHQICTLRNVGWVHRLHYL